MIQVSAPSLIGRECAYVLDCLWKNELSGTGSYVQRFEEAFALFCGSTYAISCCNGTAALHLAMLAFDVLPGEDVFIPALTYIATANAVRYCGGNPVCVDIDPDTWCMDPEDLRRKIKASQLSSGIVPVHLYGVPANMAEIMAIASEHGLWVVEDAAEAHGAQIDGKRVGSIGAMGTFSFYGNKLLTSGEGGIVTTSNGDMAARLRLYRGQGVDPERRFWHTVVGYNYRWTNVQAALALGQLERYDDHAAVREAIYTRYEAELSDFHCQRRTATSANWMFSLLVPEFADRDAVIQRMDAAGVETRPVFYPIPALPPYRGVVPPVAEMVGRRGISLPTHGRLSDDDVTTVISAFREAL